MMEITKYVRYGVRNVSVNKIFMPNGSKLYLVTYKTLDQRRLKRNHIELCGVLCNIDDDYDNG